MSEGQLRTVSACIETSNADVHPALYTAGAYDVTHWAAASVMRIWNTTGVENNGDAKIAESLDVNSTCCVLELYDSDSDDPAPGVTKENCTLAMPLGAITFGPESSIRTNVVNCNVLGTKSASDALICGGSLYSKKDGKLACED